ncbi:MAG TPA: FCD domain-containing protein [Gaiellaceae bacterium]|nr:FCD domain-containing protein [Gaiellaceae bacterium]
MTSSDLIASAPAQAGSASGRRGRDLAELILAECAGEAPGARLPTERRLAQELGVTRAAVRHALSYLEAAGRVSREVGRGTFLRGPADDLADDVGPADVMAARELFEPQVLPFVVTHATARDFAELDRCLRGGEAAGSPEEFEQWDDLFHRTIVVAAHNRLILRMYSSIEAARHGPLWGNLKRSNDSRERRVLYIEDHRRIVEALRARELDDALEATRAHLERVRANLLGPAAVG